MIYYSSKYQGFLSTIWSDTHIRALFGTRELTKKALYNHLQIHAPAVKKIIVPTQVHGDYISVIKDKGSVTADALITTEKNIGLAISTADCVPLIIYDPVWKIAAISHQGWRGILQELPSKLVQTFKKMGSRPDTLRAAIGPSINLCCFEVSADVYRLFNKRFGKTSETCFSYISHISLPYLTHRLLVEAGIPEKQIDHFPFCTKCDKERFSSHRRTPNVENMVSYVFMN